MRRALSSLLALALAGCVASAPPPVAPHRPPPRLLLDGVPPLPPALLAEVGAFRERDAATFLDWSPQGEMLVALRDGSGPGRLHLVAGPGAAPRPLPGAEAAVDDARWNPDPRRALLLLVGDRDGDERFRLHLYDAARGARRQLASDAGRDVDALWSNRGDRFAFSSNRQDGLNTGIWIGDADGGDPEPVLTTPGAFRALAWRADDAALLVLEEVTISESRLALLDLASRTLRPLLPEVSGVQYAAAAFAPDGGAVLFAADVGGERATLQRLDLASGARTVLSAPVDADVESLRLSPDGRWLAYTVDRDGASRLALLDLTTGRTHAGPALPPGVITGFGFDRASRRLGISSSAGDAPGEAWAFDLPDGSLVRWTSARLEGAARDAPVAPRSVRLPTFDAVGDAPRTLQALVYRPRAAGPMPVLVLLHGGPEAQARPAYSAQVQQLVASVGCAVVLPNVRGSTGAGRTFVALDDRLKREDAVADVGAVLDWIAAQPDLDATRVAVAGGSYGGYLALAALARYPQRLVAGVEVAGITDFVGFLRDTELGRRAHRRAEYGDERDPFTRAFLDRISPLRAVARIEDPVLAVHGRNDPRVPWQGSERLVQALRARGREAWLLVAADEGHGFRKPDNVAAQDAATVLFLRKAFAVSGAAATPR